MKTAIVYSGHMRSLARCIANHRWMVWRHFPGADTFCATVFDQDSSATSLLGTDKVHVESHQPGFALPKGCPEQWNGPSSHYMHEPYAISVPPSAVIGQLWQLNNAWGLIANPDDYDCFIRIRPDIYFHEYQHARGVIFPPLCHTPYWGRFGGLNDRFAVMGRDAAKAYFTTYTRIGELIEAGCPLHPESLLLASIERANCFNKPSLRALFSKMGKDGAITRWPEIALPDIA